LPARPPTIAAEAAACAGKSAGRSGTGGGMPPSPALPPILSAR